jgi:transcriptional regulator with XRE-family HTH domain
VIDRPGRIGLREAVAVRRGQLVDVNRFKVGILFAMSVDVGRCVLALRRALGLSQAALAERVNLLSGLTWHQTTVAKIENGERDVSVTDALALADAFALTTWNEQPSIDRLLYGVPQRPLDSGGEVVADAEPWTDPYTDTGSARFIDERVAVLMLAELEALRHERDDALARRIAQTQARIRDLAEPPGGWEALPDQSR